MSQFPSPYSGPVPYGYDPAASMLAPARRAAVLMLMLGGLSLMCGSCLVALPHMAAFSRIPLDNPQLQQSVQELRMTPREFLRAMFLVGGGIAIGFAVVQTLLGIFVWRGAFGAIVTAIVLTILGALFAFLQVFSGLVSLRAGQVLPLAIALIIVAIHILLLVWLFQAASASKRVSEMRKAAHAQYWQFQQHQQMYAQPQGYGYGAAPSQSPSAQAPPQSPPPQLAPQQLPPPPFPPPPELPPQE